MTDLLKPRSGSDAVAHLFVDFSNLWYGVRSEATRRGDPDWAVRLHSDNLRRVLAAGRTVGEAVLVANKAVPEAVLRHFRPAFRVEVVETGSISGTEQGADELLQNAIYRTILGPARPGVIVVATGDGARWQEGRGFCAALEGARRQGLGIEVAAFAASLNRHLRALANETCALVALDRYYESIAFLEGLRSVRSLSLTHRATATPARWPENGGATMGVLPA